MTSDIDFIVVTKDDLADEQVSAAQALHLETYEQNNRWVKRLEYSYFPKDKLANLSSFPQQGKAQAVERNLWYFDNGHKDIEQSDHCNTLVTRWTVREKGITVFGPNPHTLIPPIPPDSLRRENRSVMISWGKELLADPEPYRNRFYQSYIVLNYARMLLDFKVAEIRSKRAGMEWAKQNMDPKWRSLLDFCWTERQDPDIHISQPADDKIYLQTLAFVREAIQAAEQFKV